MYLNFVFEPVLSSNLIVYPTYYPALTPLSKLTLSAMLTAAILLGCVMITLILSIGCTIPLKYSSTLA